MQNAIKIIAIGKGGYEQGSVEQTIISFDDLDDSPFPEEILVKTVSDMRKKIMEQELLTTKNKKK